MIGDMKTFKPYLLDQWYLLPPSLREWLPEGHLAYFISDVVGTLDLTPIFQAYEHEDDRGQPPYHPAMMVTLLLYAYCTGKPSSRRIEKATWEEVPFRVLAAGHHPDHDSFAEFRRQHLKALAGLFAQVLSMCRRAGLVKVGVVALDGTKVKANASKHKAMSYGRMGEAEARLVAEVDRLLAEAEAVDAEEDARYGKGRRGDELPAELARRESRLAKIREAKESLEREARAEAERKAAEARAKIAVREEKERRTGKKPGGRPPAAPDPEKTVPEAKAQRNFTDPESRIMKDGATKSFVQAYNAQAAVDGDSQVIVACAVTQEANDKRQLAPMVEKVARNLGKKPVRLLADAGYFSEEALADGRLAGIDLYVPPDRRKHGDADPDAGEPRPGESAAGRMRARLGTPEGRAAYAARKAIVEPVFGQIKEPRGFRRFSFRGLARVAAEWDLVCLTHNLLKLFRAGFVPQTL
jgi:transposase